MLSAAELSSITATVQGALDKSVMRYRDTPSSDGYGHNTLTTDPTGLAIPCNLIKPSSTQLQTYAEIIAGQAAMMIRVMQTADVIVGDRIHYDNRDWRVQPIQNTESYTVTKEFLMTVVLGR